MTGFFIVNTVSDSKYGKVMIKDDRREIYSRGFTLFKLPENTGRRVINEKLMLKRSNYETLALMTPVIHARELYN